MKKLLLSTAVVFGALYFGSLPVRADVIYTLNTSNDTSVKTGSGAGGPGPYAQVEIHLIDATHATAMFSGLNSFSFGEMGLDINASSFGISGLSFTLAPGVTKTPDYTIVMGGKVGSASAISRWTTPTTPTVHRTRSAVPASRYSTNPAHGRARPTC